MEPLFTTVNDQQYVNMTLEMCQRHVLIQWNFDVTVHHMILQSPLNVVYSLIICYCYDEVNLM